MYRLKQIHFYEASIIASLLKKTMIYSKINTTCSSSPLLLQLSPMSLLLLQFNYSNLLSLCSAWTWNHPHVCWLPPNLLSQLWLHGVPSGAPITSQTCRLMDLCLLALNCRWLAESVQNWWDCGEIWNWCKISVNGCVVLVYRLISLCKFPAVFREWMQKRELYRTSVKGWLMVSQRACLHAVSFNQLYTSDFYLTGVHRIRD